LFVIEPKVCMPYKENEVRNAWFFKILINKLQEKDFLGFL